MASTLRNPHAGMPFSDDDATIAAALDDVSIPALLCSLVHLTGDPSWIRGDLRPQASTLNDYQCAMGETSMAEARRRALPAIARFRDGGCVLPPALSHEVVHEMMSFLACDTVPADVVPMFFEDLHLDGAGARAITWRDEIPAAERADAHVVVIGCGESGLLAGIRLGEAGIFYPGAGLTIEGSRIDPAFDDGDGLAINERNRATRDVFWQMISTQLVDHPALLAKVLPDYPVTAKRMLQDNGSWLDCLKMDNVELVRTGIDRIVADGVITEDGTFHAADIICYATGFRHNDYLWPMTITGRGGHVLRDQWGDEPTAYLGITVPNFPNLFCLYGPGTNLAHGGSLIFQSESQMHYIMGALRELLAEGHRTLKPRLDIHDDYSRRYQAEIAQMVWAHWSVKHSHYKNADGRIFTLSPWPIPTYWRWTSHFEPSDYVYT